LANCGIISGREKTPLVRSETGQRYLLNKLGELLQQRRLPRRRTCPEHRRITGHGSPACLTPEILRRHGQSYFAAGGRVVFRCILSGEEKVI